MFRTLIAAGLVSASLPAGAAALTIDPFTTTSAVFANLPPLPTTDTTTIGIGERTLSIANTVDAGFVGGAINEPNPGVFTFSGDADYTLAYGSSGSPLDLDLSGGIDFVLDFANLQGAVNTDLDITLNATSGLGTAGVQTGTAFQSLGLGANGTTGSFSAGIAGLGIDPSDVDVISLSFDAPEAADVRTTGAFRATVVPVPATLPLMLGGIAGLAWVARRRRG